MEDREGAFFLCMREAADSASLSLIARASHAILSDVAASINTESTSLALLSYSKLLLHDTLEGIPNLHFSVTVLAFTYSSSGRISVSLNVLSIFTSTYVSFCAVSQCCNMLYVMIATWTDPRSSRPVTLLLGVPVFLSLCGLAVVIVFAVIRVSMIPFCADHVVSVM